MMRRAARRTESRSVVVAVDKFKGSLSAVEVGIHLASGLQSVRPSVTVVRLPVADGGDGTVDAAVANGFTRVAVTATGPTGLALSTSYALRGSEAVVELASICGLLRLPGRLEPMSASSYGLGEVVRHAVLGGARRVIIGLGGSASTDGGAGFLQGLGAKVVDAVGNPLRFGGEALLDVSFVDLQPIRRLLAGVELIVACDVENPLLGPSGAAAVYAPQKGASPSQVHQLEAGLTRWSQITGSAMPAAGGGGRGTGAAGGVGFAALTLLAARFRSGISVVLDLVGFKGHLSSAQLVITGEGCIDAQTLAGKGPAGVAAASKAADVRAIAVCGINMLPPDTLENAGIAAVYALTDLEPDVSSCMSRAASLLELVGASVAREQLRW